MAFSESDIAQIWELFQLPRDQLATGSQLRTATSQLEQFDATYSQNLVGTVKDLLGEIEDLEASIVTALDESGKRRVDIYQEIEVEYKDNASAGQSLISQKQAKTERIRTILELDQYITDAQPYARVIGIGRGNAAYRFGNH